MSKQLRWIFGLTLACLAAAVLLPAIPQPLGYHAFADDRTLLRIPNFFDVVSSAAFGLAGIAGLAATLNPQTRFLDDRGRWPYAALFLGVLLTAFGSAYYHLAPDNERLFWDRLPMTIAFMSLVASQIADRIGARMGVALLVPLLLLGAASVVYWRATERMGAGNLTPYLVVQVYAVLVLLLLASFTHSRYSRGHLLFWALGWYCVSKGLEALDRQIFALGGVVSGHTLKHLAAAAAVAVLWRMLVSRDLAANDVSARARCPSG